MSYTIKTDAPAHQPAKFEIFPTILAALAVQRVFKIIGDGGEFYFEENCDGNFGVWLTADQVRALAAELIAVADGKLQPPRQWD